MSRGMCTITFRVEAATSFGEKLFAVGSDPAFGAWDVEHALPLTTTEKDYPCWTTGPVSLAVVVDGAPIEYKYILRDNDGNVRWEVEGDNRRVPTELGAEGTKPFIIDDGCFSMVTEEVFGYPADAGPPDVSGLIAKGSATSEKLVVVLGDGIAAGHRAWRLDGWASKLAKALKERYQFELLNLAKPGQTAKATLADLSSVVAPLRPKVVVLAFGSEVHRLAYADEAEWPQVVSQYASAIEDLIAEVWMLGAVPIIAGPYPHDQFLPEHRPFLKQIDDRLRQAGVHMIDFMSAVTSESERGLWQEGLSHGAGSPNTKGQAKMFSCINLGAFEPEFVSRVCSDRAKLLNEDRVVFKDGKGFEVRLSGPKQEITVANKTQNEYSINPGWHELQAELEGFGRLVPLGFRQGMYLSPGGKAVWLSARGRIETQETFQPDTVTTFQHFNAYSKGIGKDKVLYNDGNLAVLHESDAVRLVNLTSSAYNVHPMWQEVRCAMKALPYGVYEDNQGWDFRSAVVSCHGLQSRVKVPANLSLYLKKTGELSSLERVALVPLGDRCSARMLLHKIEYDGPCYPFDLTRTTCLGDVADIIATGFSEMWNQDLLEYDHELGRIHHRKWQGLSFAHEVEDGDDPIMDFGRVAGRMAKRYGSRAARFDFACKNADRVLFLRTGGASRNEVNDLMYRLGQRYPGMIYSLLLISDQDTGEFSGIKDVRHIREHFNPDQMYEDMNYWVNCSHRFRGILQGLNVDARTLYWCPNNLKEAEAEMKGESKAVEALPVKPSGIQENSRSLSHSKLYEMAESSAAAAAAAASQGGQKTITKESAKVGAKEMAKPNAEAIAKETPKKNASETPEEVAKETPKEIDQDPPKRSVNEIVKGFNQRTKDSIKENVKETPKEPAKESPKEAATPETPAIQGA